MGWFLFLRSPDSGGEYIRFPLVADSFFECPSLESETPDPLFSSHLEMLFLMEKAVSAGPLSFDI